MRDCCLARWAEFEVWRKNGGWDEECIWEGCVWAYEASAQVGGIESVIVIGHGSSGSDGMGRDSD